MDSLQLGIVDDEIVEGPQSFSVTSVEVSPANTVTILNSLSVTIEDNDCEWNVYYRHLFDINCLFMQTLLWILRSQSIF